MAQSYQESVKFIFQHKPNLHETKPLYKSKFPPDLVPSYSTFATITKVKNAGGKFHVNKRCFTQNVKNGLGEPKDEVKKSINPQQFLKKGERKEKAVIHDKQMLDQRSDKNK